jgi:hypothetical protein
MTGLDLAGAAGLIQEVRLPTSAATAYRPRCRGDEVPVARYGAAAGWLWARSVPVRDLHAATIAAPAGLRTQLVCSAWGAIRRSTPGWPAALSTALEVAMTCVPLTSDDSQPQKWSAGNPAVIAG